MKVLLVTPDYPPTLGGIQRLLHRITGAMIDTELRVLTMRSPGWKSFDAANPVTVKRVPGLSRRSVVRNGAFNLTAAVAAPRWRPDVILNGHVVTGPTAYVLAKRSRVANVLYTYGKEVGGRPGMTAWSMRRSDAAVTVSDYTRQQMLGTLDGPSPIPITVVHPGVDIPPEPGRADADRPTIVTTARLRDWYKGHDVMLDAMRIVVKSIPDAHWVVIGDGRIRPDLERRTVERDLGGHVTFLGAASDAARDEWMARAHVFAMPTRYPMDEVGGEGFPVVYLEAAAWALPAVAGDIGGPAEAVLNEGTGLLVDSESAEAVATALVRLLDDPLLARRMGSAARARALENFTWAAVGDELRSALASAVDLRRTGAGN